MIRKLLLSLLLIAAGLGVLHLVIGFENFANVDERPTEEPIKRTQDDRGLGGGINIAGGEGSGPAIAVSGSGEFRVDRTEWRTLEGGVRKKLPVYQLIAEDSDTVAEDLLRLDRVTVRVFRIDDEPEPHEVQIGTITARQAFVQIGRDEAGKPSVREDRDMDLREVVMESTPEARLQGLRLEVARLRVRQTEQGVDFRTPDVSEPFSLTLLGDEPTALTGLGVRGILPGSSREPGGVLEVHVNSQPVLVRGGTRVRSKGPLDYVEDVAAGIGDVALVEEVVLEGVPGESAGDPTRATGERMIGRLVRFRPAGAGAADGTSSRAAWLGLRLDGSPAAPATLARGGLDLSCLTLVVRPAFGGAAAAFVAEGSPELTEPSTGLRFSAERRIHVVDLSRFLEPLHSRFGYQTPYFGRLAGQLVAFEGRSVIVDPVRGLEIEAADGLRMTRSLDEDGGSVVVGSGAVSVKGEDLTVDGPDGFVLRQLGDARTVRLGPEDAGPDHVYALVQKLTDGVLSVSGSGACQLERRADGSARIDLDSPSGDVVLERGDDVLAGVKTLGADLDAAGELTRFLAEGPSCRIETALPTRPGAPTEHVVGRAQKIASDDGRSFALTGTLRKPAVIEREDGSRVEGQLVEVHRTGAERAILIARGAPALARVPVENEGDARFIELRGAVLHFVPGLVPRALLALHGIDPRLSTGLVSDLVLAGGSVELRAIDADDETITIAHGDHLALRVEEGSATLRGNPASVESTAADGRRFVARAPVIRGAGGDFAAQRATLLPEADSGPELDVFGSEDDTAFRAFRISCPVPIVADDAGVRIDGPARVRAITADGRVDPDGIALDSAAMELTWIAGTRSVEHVVARGDAVLTYRGLLAFGDEMRIDVPGTQVEVERYEGGTAGVVLRGMRLLGARFRADYEAQELRAWGPLEGRRR